MTLSRMVDMTYRFNSGVMTLTLDRLKEISDPSYWVNAAKPVSQAQLRAEKKSCHSSSARLNFVSFLASGSKAVTFKSTNY